MIVLQSGKAKSGNFFLYKILKNIFEEAELPSKNFIQQQPIYELAKNWELSNQDQVNIDVVDFESECCFYRISSIFRMPIKDINAYLQETNHIWTHSQIKEGNIQYLQKIDKIVYIIRDPRDVAISMSKFLFTPYMQNYYPCNAGSPEDYLNESLYRQITAWVTHVGGYLKYKHKLPIHFVFYERLLENCQEEISKLTDFLGLEFKDSEAVKRIANKVSFINMKKDAPNHVREGIAQQWKKHLTRQQIKEVKQIAKPMLELLNYSIDEKENTKKLPYLPDNISDSKIQKIIETSQNNRILVNVKKRLKGWYKAKFN